MSSGGNRILLILVGIIVGFCLLSTVGVWAYVQIAGEPYTESYREPAKPIVRQNPFYAAEQFLTARGIETESEPALAAVELDDEIDLLLLLDDRRPLPQSRAQSLKAWIERGGHLICVGPAPDDDEPQQDPLLSEYDVETTCTYASWSDPETITETEVGPLGEASEVEFIPERGLIMPFNIGDCDWVWTDDDGTTHGLSLPAGKGRLTVVSDAEIWKNPGMREDGFFGFSVHGDISSGHNARLLWELASAWDAPRCAVLVYDDAYPSLWTLLVRNAWPLLLSLAVLIVVWLLGASRRFGPLLLPLSLARRSLLEHLEAAGYFMWRQDAQRPLIVASRDALRARIRRRRAHLAHLPDAELVSALAMDLGLPEASVNNALRAPVPHRADDFTLLVADVERLRRAL